MLMGIPPFRQTRSFPLFGVVAISTRKRNRVPQKREGRGERFGSSLHTLHSCRVLLFTGEKKIKLHLEPTSTKHQMPFLPSLSGPIGVRRRRRSVFFQVFLSHAADERVGKDYFELFLGPSCPTLVP